MSRENPPLKVVIKGDLWNYADPRFVDTLAGAFAEATGRHVIEISRED